jgi:hypothetical protein
MMFEKHASSETKTREYERGHRDAKNGQEGSFRGPWGRVGESDNHFNERKEAYEAGIQNWHDQKTK